MEIFFKPHKETGYILQCNRTDGSSTFSKVKPGLEFHDLAHYVVEKELAFENSFFGLVEHGFNISDFELPRDRRPEQLVPQNLPEESIITEHIVNLLSSEFLNYGRDNEFLTNLSVILQEKNLTFPQKLDEQNLKIIRMKYASLCQSILNRENIILQW